MEEGGLGCCADFDGDALTGTGAWSGAVGRKMGQGEQGLNGLWRRMHFDYGELRASTTEGQWTVEAGESNGMAIDGQKRVEQGDRVRFGGATLPRAESGLRTGDKECGGEWRTEKKDGGKQRRRRAAKRRTNEKSRGESERRGTTGQDAMRHTENRDKKRPESRSAFGALVCVTLFSDGSAAGDQSLIPFCFSFS